MPKAINFLLARVSMAGFQMRAVLLFLTLFSSPLFAQTAVKLETLLDNPVLNYSEAVIFVLEASDKAVYGDPEEAFRFASEQKWLPKKAAPTDTARLEGIALLLMSSFDQKGGIFYSLFKNPHYAYRELVQKEVIRGNTDPAMAVSGQELLLMISRLLGMKEQTEQKAGEQ